MQIYKVGGAVRDRLLGRTVHDCDWVVVGASVEQMLALGFMPIGQDFPVFLHPKTHEEYALARSERKIARGYHGFQFYTQVDVTLEDDLARRDLTINAMAEDKNGRLIDPFHGEDDLRAGLLRHIGPAFAEDPVRILRTARFAARFNFTIAPETIELMRTMVNNGEVDALVCERVWQECAKALLETMPSRFFLSLNRVGALAKLAPEIDACFTSAIDAATPLMNALDYAAQQQTPLNVRFAVLTHLATHQSLITLCSRLRVPSACRELASLVIRLRESIHQACTLEASAILALFKAGDALRRPERFRQILMAITAEAYGRQLCSTPPYHPAEHLNAILTVACSLKTATIAACYTEPKLRALAIDEARLALIMSCLQTKPPRSPSLSL